MFKLMLLGQWYGLSDAELERALKVRIGRVPASGVRSRIRSRFFRSGGAPSIRPAPAQPAA
ncbi:transposase [Tepidimonas taiwanensis]|uniref:transposase n=1 Tax=Tepidimonas taiwanensis TaxID=307486 RepID=UPI0009E084FB